MVTKVDFFVCLLNKLDKAFKLKSHHETHQAKKQPAEKSSEKSKIIRPGHPSLGYWYHRKSARLAREVRRTSEIRRAEQMAIL